MRPDLVGAEALEYLKPHAWTQPQCYFGYSPVGDFCVVGRSRESSALEESNYIVAFARLRAIAAACTPPEPRVGPEPPTRTAWLGGDEPEPRAAGWVYDFRQRHWAVGWVETLLVRADAPQPLLDAAAQLLRGLSDYPVLDEDHYSELETQQIDEYWAGLSVSDRYEAIKSSRSDASIFGARRNYLPQDSNGALYEYLRG